jgi:hypothetical protein
MRYLFSESDISPTVPLEAVLDTRMVDRPRNMRNTATVPRTSVQTEPISGFFSDCE